MSSLASSSSSMVAIDAKGAAEPLYQVKLLSALRTGDTAQVHQLISEIGKEKRRESDEGVDIAAVALHLAIRCASVETISILLQNRHISPNAVYPSGSGTTALHLAASIGRADVVNLLLEQDGIDDTLRDSQGRTCRDVARGKEVHKAIRESRALFTASYKSLLHSYIESSPTEGPSQHLLQLLSSPRAHLLDLSYLDPSSGRALLHEAARRKDLRLIDLSIRAGADVFVRDRRGKSVGESSKDEKVKVFFKQFTNQDNSLIDSSNGEPPIMRGYLNKYTNVAKGYGTRWFVLRNGILSYYRHQQDEGVASRGSIAMASAILKYNTSTAGDRLRFEVHSHPSRGGSSASEKWYIRGNQTGEVSRWTQAIQKNIDFYRGDMPSTSSYAEHDGRSLRSLATSVRTSMSSASPFNRRNGRSTPSIFKNSSPASSIMDSKDEDSAAEQSDGNAISLRHAALMPSSTPPDETDADDDHDGFSLDSRSQVSKPPHDANFTLQGNAAVAQAELTAQLLSTLKLPPDAPRELHNLKSALIESGETAQRMLNEYVRMVQEREEWWKDKLDHEIRRGTAWEESLQMVVKEGELMENELKTRARQQRVSSRVDGATTTEGEVPTPRRRTSLAPGSSLFTSVSSMTPSRDTTVTGLPASPPLDSSSFFDNANRTVQSPPPTSTEFATSASVLSAGGDTTDEEDEFFDAIESQSLPVIVPSALVAPPEVKPSIEIALKMQQFVGYYKLRTRLPIESDTRPPTSLWSVLKHSIGKDLTKISFPVFFNEPTSMLQRMAEDMEFSECLDAASLEPDPLKRIAFVAAFAMSNYSSSIGRIAKPFNPMLSETFEYVRVDKKYRYVSEQVSHHPPMSACFAESPLWHYFGEIDAQNKFMGKSFEIRPTGVAHVELKLPSSWGPDYPKAAGKWADDKVIEHYSWRKVTTSVSGFILGSPTIDHYGDMVITNHRTKDTCTLTFKPRGWRGKDAFEIAGNVKDAAGNVVYEIAGRWNSQLVARAVGTGDGLLHPDVSVGASSTSSSSEPVPEYILLWRNTEKPTAPFNLTPFAITLNDLPEDTLKPFLCPTDCRLRPDQRAFELGRYERANMLKGKQEDFQRSTRRAREEGCLPPHRPRWFEASADKETGERVWEPLRADDGEMAYWKEREGVWSERREWTDVNKIFIDDEP